MNASRRLFLSAIFGLVALFVGSHTVARAAKYCPNMKGIVVNGRYWHMCCACPGSAPPATYTIPDDHWHNPLGNQCTNAEGANCPDPITFDYAGIEKVTEKSKAFIFAKKYVKCRGKTTELGGNADGDPEGVCLKPGGTTITLDWEVTVHKEGGPDRLFRVFKFRHEKDGKIGYGACGHEADINDKYHPDTPDQKDGGVLVDGPTGPLLVVGMGTPEQAVFHVLIYAKGDEKASPSDRKPPKGEKPPKRKK